MQKPQLTPSRPARWLVALAVAALSLTVLAGCGSDSDSKGGGDALTEIPDGAYTASEVKGYELAADTSLTFTFEGDRLSVNAGCNTMNADYSLTDGVLKWTSKPAATMMACEEDRMAQDTWITGLLTKGMDATGDAKAITLTSGDVTIDLAAD